MEDQGKQDQFLLLSLYTNAERRYVRPPTMSGSRRPKRPRTLVKINPTSQASPKVVVNTRLAFPPSLYAINVTSLAKPHAKEQLHADLLYYDIGIAIISESRLA